MSPQTHGPVPHLSRHDDCDRPGRGLARGPWPGTREQQYRKHPSRAQRAAATGTPPRRHPLAAALLARQLGDRKRQAPNAKQPRRLGRRPFPPLLFLPQRQRNGCHFETSGLCPRGQAPRDSQQMSE